MRVIDYVYVIGSEDGPCKVGITNNLTSRLATVQTGSPRRLKLLYAHPCGDRAHAKENEKIFHEIYAERRLEGEWFDLSGDEAIEGVESGFQIEQWHFHRDHYARHPVLVQQ